MRFDFDTEQLANSTYRDAEAELAKCRHYGFCTATCPTYVLLGDELDSPRGRVDLIGQMLEKGGTPDNKTVQHLDRCLSCLACTTTCPTSIDYGKLIDIGREYIEKNYRRPFADRALRSLIARVLPNPRLFRLSLMASAAGRHVAPLLGSKLSGMLRMTRGMTPRRSDYEGRARVFPTGTTEHRVALLEGCVQKVIKTDITDATIRLLTRHGCEIWKPASVGCCGSLPLHMGRSDEARDYARRAVAAWHKAIVEEGVEAIIINASGCGTTVKDYGHLLHDDPEYSERAAIVAEHAMDVAEWMVKIGVMPCDPMNLRVVYHDPCSLQHAQRVIRQPRTLLTAIGCTVFDAPERHMCCGSAGTYNMLQPEVATQLGKRKAMNIVRMKPDIVATGNIGCITQIEQYSDTPIVHLVELLDWATGGPRPAAVNAELQERN